MSRTLDTLLRPSLLAMAIALSAPLASSPLIAAEQASSVRAYNLPAAPLATTLNQIASQAGLALTLNPALAAGKTSAPVQGQFDAQGALREALRGTGLQLEQSSAGTYTLMPVPEGVVALPTTNITGQGSYESAWGPVEGYVAKRTAAGTKTDTALVEAPRSISVATREQMQDRNVQNLDDAVKYMPGIVSASYGSDTRYDWMRVRGFEPTQFLDGLPLPRGVYANPKPGTSTASPCCAVRPRQSMARPLRAACWIWSAAAPALNRATPSRCNTAVTTTARSISKALARSMMRASFSTALAAWYAMPVPRSITSTTSGTTSHRA